jgi:hypothetical protein
MMIANHSVVVDPGGRCVSLVPVLDGPELVRSGFGVDRPTYYWSRPVFDWVNLLGEVRLAARRDCSGLTSIDSSGLRMLVHVGIENTKTLVLRGVPEQLRPVSRSRPSSTALSSTINSLGWRPCWS